ncbi:hydroxyethylthiazole kinase [Mesorhizobium sp. CAU 1741]|uniref:hydroxyethylthiazole kinase n=1 Tax=Mesorhizobium sp. CAU 1741 TaxID=3140366 RepID=UPI00325C0951
MTDDLSPGTMLTAMRRETPLVHCITNFVAMNVAANVLLAAGASPAMIHAEAEAGEFAAIAGALTINIGTLSPVWLQGMHAAVDGARQAGRPWVLDPVAHHATAYRRKAALDLLGLSPNIVRGNASEIIALSGATGHGRGVDSRDTVTAAEDAARSIARMHGAVVAVTGAVDFVTDGERAYRVEGGSPFMPQVTALGCSLTCLVGAFAAAFPRNPLEATTAALAHFAVAGEKAARDAAGPGSFGWRFLDALAAVDGDALDAGSRVAAA